MSVPLLLFVQLAIKATTCFLEELAVSSVALSSPSVELAQVLRLVLFAQMEIYWSMVLASFALLSCRAVPFVR
jgi:hypothetical protein